MRFQFTHLPVVLSVLTLFAAQDSHAFSIVEKPVSSLLQEYRTQIDELKTKAGSIMDDPPTSDVFYLRYCLDGDAEESMDSMMAGINWRKGEGKGIYQAALAALEEATGPSGWNNDPVRAQAPHAETINKFITPSQILTTTSRLGDLVYCIRAGKIDDKELMSTVSEDQMVDFFLYCKEVNAMVADMRSVSLDRLVCVLTANDLSGVKLVGGDARFRSALSAASKRANNLYPSSTLNGPTLLLNLPPLFGALVKLFTPLFPKEVRRRLRFEQGPLKNIDNLKDIATATSSPAREAFLGDLDKLVYAN